MSRRAPVCQPLPWCRRVCAFSHKSATVGLVHAELAQYLRICRKKSQIQHAVAAAVARTSGRSDRPTSDPEMDTLEVTGHIAFLNVVALKNKPDHQVDADGERR